MGETHLKVILREKMKNRFHLEVGVHGLKLELTLKRELRFFYAVGGPGGAEGAGAGLGAGEDGEGDEGGEVGDSISKSW